MRHEKNKRNERDCKWLKLHACNTRQVIVNFSSVDKVLDNSLQSATMDPYGRITFLLGKEKFIIIIIIINYGRLLYPVNYYQIPWKATRLKTAFPHSCRLHFIPFLKDAGFNTNYNLFIFYS